MAGYSFSRLSNKETLRCENKVLRKLLLAGRDQQNPKRGAIAMPASTSLCPAAHPRCSPDLPNPVQLQRASSSFTTTCKTEQIRHLHLSHPPSCLHTKSVCPDTEMCREPTLACLSQKQESESKIAEPRLWQQANATAVSSSPNAYFLIIPSFPDACFS